MKHIFILQGKKFISSKRASKISDYSSDYIGQLCRAQKLDCRMFGHTWFVTEESLRQYSANVKSEEALKNRIDNIRGSVDTDSIVTSNVFDTSAEVKSIAGSSPVISTVDDSNNNVDGLAKSNSIYIDRLTTKEAAELSGYTSDYIGQLCRGGKLNARTIGNSWLITKDSLLAHMDKIRAEKEADRQEALQKEALKEATRENAKDKVKNIPDLSPEMKEIANSIFRPVEYKADINRNTYVEEDANERYEEENKRVERVVSYPTLVRSIILRRVIGATLAIVLIAGVSLISFNLLNRGGDEIVAESSIETDQSAGVFDAFNRFTTSLHNGFNKVLSVFTRFYQISMDTPSQTGPSYSKSDAIDKNGLVIAPSSGVKDVDSEMKKDIANSFSDQVTVKPDNSGTAGVITPVFREANGKDFVYVMVPINNPTKTK